MENFENKSGTEPNEIADGNSVENVEDVESVESSTVSYTENLSENVGGENPTPAFATPAYAAASIEETGVTVKSSGSSAVVGIVIAVVLAIGLAAGAFWFLNQTPTYQQLESNAFSRGMREMNEILGIRGTADYEFKISPGENFANIDIGGATLGDMGFGDLNPSVFSGEIIYDKGNVFQEFVYKNGTDEILSALIYAKGNGLSYSDVVMKLPDFSDYFLSYGAGNFIDNADFDKIQNDIIMPVIDEYFKMTADIEPVETKFSFKDGTVVDSNKYDVRLGEEQLLTLAKVAFESFATSDELVNMVQMQGGGMITQAEIREGLNDSLKEINDKIAEGDFDNDTYVTMSVHGNNKGIHSRVIELYVNNEKMFTIDYENYSTNTKYFTDVSIGFTTYYSESTASFRNAGTKNGKEHNGKMSFKVDGTEYVTAEYKALYTNMLENSGEYTMNIPVIPSYDITIKSEFSNKGISSDFKSDLLLNSDVLITTEGFTKEKPMQNIAWPELNDSNSVNLLELYDYDYSEIENIFAKSQTFQEELMEKITDPNYKKDLFLQGISLAMMFGVSF